MKDLYRLLALLLVFAFLGGAYSIVTPLFEAPDEVWHYAYVRYLAEGNGLPALNNDESGAHQEVAQPPLYYAAAALVSRAVPDDDLAELLWHNPGFGYQAGATVNDNKNMLIHTQREKLPWRGAVLAVRLARFVSLTFGLLTLVAAWGLGREAFPDQPELSLGVAAVVAVTPQFLFMSGVVSNDTASAALSAGALWVIAIVFDRGATLCRSLGVGLLIGLAALTKTSALLLWPLAVVTLLAARRPLRERLRGVVTASATTTAVCGWWYLRNAILYDDPFGLKVHVDTPWGRSTPATFTGLVAELPRVYKSFWGAFGWGHVMFPPWIYVALGGAVVTGLIGWGWKLKTRKLSARRGLFLLAAVWCLLVFTALLQWMRQVEAPHGRLLFPAIGGWALLLVTGWSALSAKGLRSLFLLVLALLSLLTPWAVIRPAFALPRLVSPEEATATVRATELTFGGAARLLGVALEEPSVAPGDQFALRACWEGVMPMDEDYTVFIHLVGKNDARAAERYTYPGLGRFPTSLWPVDRAFCDVYRLRAEKWAPVPELYDVVIGLFDATSGERLSAHSLDGSIVEFPVVAQLRVAPEGPLDIDPEYRTEYRFGDDISLVGYDLAGNIRSGALVTVTLYWRAERVVQGDYAAFVHLLDEAGTVLAQHDGIPRDGRYPTPAWQDGDIIPDEHVLRASRRLAGSEVRLATGMYQRATLDRLRVLGPEGPVADNLILLPVTY